MDASVTGADPGPAAGDLDERAERKVLADLRRARRQWRTREIDMWEALYRAYLTGILSGIAVWVLSGVVGDNRVGAAAAARVTAHGAPIVGALVAVALAIGVRSGGNGGPLVIEAADVRHVLLSPIDRALALRGPAVRQIRFGVAVATGAGAIGGLLAYRRLPGEVLAWVACGALTAVFAIAGSYGLALLASGRRIGRVWGSLAALVVVGWSALDILTNSTTSPATWVGELALWPLDFRPLALVGAAICAAVLVLGLRLVGGTSIEAAERRATLVGQIRFAATMRDLRTVVVLRRQLAQELPRQRPWVRLPRAVPAPGIPGAGRAKRRWWPLWRRGWHGILRFPAVRIGRLAVFGAVAGAAVVGAVHGTTPLIIVGGLSLYVAGMDALEPLSQELDHPDRTESYAIEQGVLLLRMAGPSLLFMVLITAVGWGVAVAMTGGSAVAVGVGGVLVVPAAVCAVAGAGISLIAGAPPSYSATESLMPPEMAGFKAGFRAIIPPLVALVGVLPALAARHPAAGVSPEAAVGTYLPPIVFMLVLVGVWVRYKQRMSAWWREAMEEAKSQRPGARPAAGGE